MDQTTSMVMPDVVFADKKRLRNDLRTQTNLTGIMTYIKLDNGQYHVLSRFEQDTWLLPDNWFPNDTREYHRKLNFANITTPSLKSAAKIIMARLIWGDESLRGRRRGTTLQGSFSMIVSFLKWLPTLKITTLSDVNPLVAMQYVTYVKSLKSNRIKKQDKSIATSSIFKRLYAVEVCYWQSRETQYGFEHPWPESSAQALSGDNSRGKPKTEIIPDKVLVPLFQHAELVLGRASEMLRLQTLLSEFVPKGRNKTSQSAERATLLKNHGWQSDRHKLNKSVMELRNCCFLIILLTTGIRIHEMCNLKRGNWYSEVRDSERFYFIGSKSEKTGEGNTHWLCPEITINALKVLDKLMLPMQALLEEQLVNAQLHGEIKEAERLKRFSGSLMLGKITNQSNRISVLNGFSVNDSLQQIADALALDFNLTPHQFRRTFAVYVVHHKLGDLRYLRDHFKHWSMDMSILYGMNDKQDLELYNEIYAAFDDERQGIIGHWLEPDTPISGGLAPQIRNLRDKNTPTRTYKSRSSIIRLISEQVYLRSTGLAWCTNDDGSCAGGQCDECEHAVIDDKKQAFWEGVYAQQTELKQIDDLGDSGQSTVNKAILRCEKVLSDLGADIEAIKLRVNNHGDISTS